MTDQISGITIRRLGPEDADSVAHLAGLDSSLAPEGALLGAEVEGRLLAVVSLADGVAVADPFSRTAELRALLDLRAEQLRNREAPHRGLRAGAERRIHSRAALAGSVPGAGGRLLTLE